MEEVHERKRGKYRELEAECRKKGCRVSCQPFEVWRVSGNSFFAFFARLGVCGMERRRRMCERVAQLALNGSLWIWKKFIEAGRTVYVEIDRVVFLSALKAVVTECGRDMERCVWLLI